MATSAFSTGISWIDTARENTRVISFVLAVVEDTPFHPIGSFVVASFAVFALGRFEIAKVFKHQDGCLMLLSKLDNASTHQMCYLLVYVADLLPEMCIVLLALCDDASLASVACDAS